jgi:S-formylglutathione hydrolase FrmB
MRRRTAENAPGWPEGQLVTLNHRSEVLADNPWGDPVERAVQVYLPAGYEASDQDYPVFWHLAAYTNSGASVGNWKNFGETLPERLDRLIGSGQMGAVVVVAPDCFTTLGGNQYVNAPAVGRYDDYIHQELLPFVEREFRVRSGAEHRAVFGKSSGGYAALRFGMLHPGVWGAIADHSGDAQFEVIFPRDFPTAATTLSRYDGDICAFIEAFWASDNVRGSDVHTLMMICMAASYDADVVSPSTIRLPFDLDTLERDESRWRHWLAHDPVQLIDQQSEALDKLRGIYMDCGFRDQYHIHYGCRVLSRKMKALGIDHIYEEFDGTHSQIDHRLDRSLPFLYRALTSEATARD